MRGPVGCQTDDEKPTQSTDPLLLPVCRLSIQNAKGFMVGDHPIARGCGFSLSAADDHAITFAVAKLRNCGRSSPRP